MSGKEEIEVELGDNGAGTHCDDQFMNYAGGGAVVGNTIHLNYTVVCFSWNHGPISALQTV